MTEADEFQTTPSLKKENISDMLDSERLRR